MNEKQIETIAKEYMRQLGYCENSVANLKIEFRKKHTNLGICYRKEKRIIFNERELGRDDTFWNDLIAHEVAHFRARGHGKRFRMILTKLNQGAMTRFGRPTYCTNEKNICAGIKQTFEVD